MEVEVTSQLLTSCIVCPIGPARKAKEIKLVEYGALVVRNFNDRVTHVVVSDLDDLEDEDLEQLAQAQDLGIAAVNYTYFNECISNQRLIDNTKHLLKAPTKSKKKTSNNNNNAAPKSNKRKLQDESSDGDYSDGDDDDSYSAKSTKKASSTGAKKKMAADEKEFKGEAGKNKKAKTGVVQVLKKGNVPVDTHCHQLVSTTHVLEEPGCEWSCTLNQTQIQSNNNKFYIIQLLEIDNTKNKWWTWNRWGRIGATGQSALKEFTSLPAAKKDYEKKFRDKTKNDWSDRGSFKSVKGSYTLIAIDYGDDDKKDDASDDGSDGDDDASGKKSSAIPDSQLAMPLQDLIKLICDVGTMKKSMISMNFDIKKVPLGQIKKVTLEKASSVLQKLEKVLKAGGNKTKIYDYSNQFYTLIPHYFGMSTPPPINTLDMLQKKYDMLEDLGFMQVASTVLKEAQKHHTENPIDAKYNALNTTLTPLSKKSEIYAKICENVKMTHGHTHVDYKLQVNKIFEVNRKEDEEAFEEFSADIDNHRLLWHGSRITNWYGILSQGLQIAPPSAPVTGYMFGKGLYFADMVSKSTNYCLASKSFPEGIALLCEVALGSSMELTEAKYIEQLNKKYQSCKGVGKTVPQPGKEEKVDGAYIALGKGVDNEEIDDSALQYNEYVVYNTAQCRMKYLVHFDFIFK